MTYDPIFDGKCHVLSEKFGYICRKINEKFFIEQEEKELEEQLSLVFMEYARYLCEHDKELAIIYLTNKFKRNYEHNYTDKNFELIIKPASFYSGMHENGTVSIKFFRNPNDGLT